MQDIIDAIFNNQVLAVAVPAIIFLITVVLIVRRLASFVVTCALLVFALLSGFAIFHHDVVANWIRGGVSEQEYTVIKSDLNKFKDQIWEAFKQLKDDLSQPRTPEPTKQSETDASIREIQERFAALERMLQEEHERSREVGAVDPQ